MEKCNIFNKVNEYMFFAPSKFLVFVEIDGLSETHSPFKSFPYIEHNRA